MLLSSDASLLLILILKLNYIPGNDKDQFL